MLDSEFSESENNSSKKDEIQSYDVDKNPNKRIDLTGSLHDLSKLARSKFRIFSGNSSAPNETNKTNDTNPPINENKEFNHVSQDITENILPKNSSLRSDTQNATRLSDLVTSETQSSTYDDLPFDPETIEYNFDAPSQATYATVKYESPNRNGDELNPGKRIIYRIPKEYQGRKIRDVVLTHRKDPQRWDGTGIDPNGAYDRVEVVTSKGSIQQWIDPAGHSPDKFAESRSSYDPEVEVLHDWLATVGEVNPQVISLLNVGKGELAISNVHSLEVIFFPDSEGLTFQETIFSPGTHFIDKDKGIKVPTYGYIKSEGIYPGAVALGRYNSDELQVSHDSSNAIYFDTSGRLHLKLIPGKKFVSLELAAGDTHPDKVVKKGHMGTRGWAKLYAGISQKGQHVPGNYFMDRVNVPPAGVLFGGPNEMEHIVEEDEEIVIESRSDTTYLMGFRIGYNEKET